MSRIIMSVFNGIGTITLNNPTKRKALSTELMDDLIKPLALACLWQVRSLQTETQGGEGQQQGKWLDDPDPKATPTLQ